MDLWEVEKDIKETWFLNKILYFHIWDNHFKMWGYEINVNYDKGEPCYDVLFYWGKIIKNIKQLKTVMKTDLKQHEIFELLSNKIYEKLHKGYIPIHRKWYFQYANGIVSQSNFIRNIKNSR